MGYKIENQGEIHFLRMTVVGWADIFSRQIYRDIVLQSMKYSMENKSLIVYAYVIMTNHIHCIWQAKNSNLSDIVRDFKKFTSSQIVKMTQSNIESRSEWLKIIFEYHAKFKIQQ
jgi:REP element-mobilizing transposase RayT